MQLEPPKQKNIALYIHWPFCLSKCPYCDFNSHVSNSVDHIRWKYALLKELAFMGEETRGRKLKSVFFGGGTPSLMATDTVKFLIDALADFWEVDDPEITLEANPNSVEVSKFKEFREAGVNRVSLGIQSLDAKSLEFLGRSHSLDDAKRAIEIAASTFDRYSIDLIYARPQQTLQQWEDELGQALPYIRDHVSLYQLTIEPGTAFHTQHMRKDFTLPNDSLAARMYDRTNEILKTAGLERYEVSNYAKPGRECMHNLVYWRYQGYVGVGPGAHGRFTVDNQRIATTCYRAPETWLTQVEQHGHGVQEKTVLTLKEQIVESLIMGLRLKEGISFQRFFHNFKNDITAVLGEDRIQNLINEGYVATDEEYLKVTDKGFLRLNAIINYFCEPLIPKAQRA